MGRFDDKTAVITGGASGIGLATATLLAQEGAYVVIAGRDTVRGAAAAAVLGDRGEFVQTDVGQDRQVAELAALAAKRTGHIDYWFNNAGYEGPVGPFDLWTEENITELLDTNIKGVLSGLRHAAANIGDGGGVIVNTASFIGTRHHVPIAVAYGATKAAVISASASAAVALEPAGVRVYALCPWIIDTPMLERFIGSTTTAAKQDFAANFNPSGRLATPGDIAVAFADLVEGRLDVPNGGAFLVDAGAVVTPI
ncbi:MAG TPA: SDR family NAD(P)-dependent oxidoreductase [Actinomycetes bacterium]|nr:SDR family NAD(P)-dependent oxidoreductase [Actinomycetes bacterium]